MPRGDSEHAVVVVGAGPTGLMLAAELTLGGVDDVVVVERRPDQHVDGSRAGGLLPRSIEVLDQRGVADRFLAAGQTLPAHGFAGIRFDISDLPTRHHYVLALRQRDFEPILAHWVEHELGVRIVRATDVTGFVQHDAGVDVELDDGRHLGARYLVGCDGGRSVVRAGAGIAFAGTAPARSWIVAEVDAPDEPPPGMRTDAAGMHGAGRIGAGGPIRVVLTEATPRRGEPGIDELRAALVAVYGTDFGLTGVRWASRFTDATGLAADYRDRRVLLAGDAAHVHPPHGGQGLNTGLQDAVNLGWKLALVVRGDAGDAILDTYAAERRPVAARVLHNTLAQVALTSGGDQHQALRDVVGDLLAMPEPRHHVAAMLTALDVRYDVGQGDGALPVVGLRMPDVELDTADGPTRVATLLHAARPLLLHLAGPHPCERQAPSAQAIVVHATCAPEWELPVLGTVPAPPAVLVRPDGHVAWAGAPTDPELASALSTWCGAPPRDAGPVAP